MIAMDVDAALTEVPVNVMPLLDDGDFKTIEASVAYNAAGMALYWHFVTSAGVETTTQVTPTTGGTYDWAHAGQGMYTIEIPASGGASINNDTEGYGYFTGVATGVLPWRGPTICFRAAAINDALCDGGDLLDVSVTQLAGVPQSLTDLKNFADDGYDPSTNKVQGLVLADAVTTVNGLAADTITATSIAANAITAAKIATGAIDADALAADAVDEIWDEVMVGTLTARSALSVASSGGLGAFSVNDAGASTTAFVTDLTSSVDDFYRDMQIQFTSGALAGQVRIVSDYVGSTKTVTLDEALTSAPANGVTFVLSGPHTHTVSSIADSVWASATRVLTAGTNIQLPSNGLANVTAWTVNLTGTLSGNVGGIAGTTNTFDALQTALNSAHGSGSWATATGFSTHSASDVWAVATRVLTAGTNIQLPSNGLANVTSWTVGITGNITGNLSGSVGSVTTVSDKTGYALSSTGLNLVIPADPSAIPVLGTANLPTWIAWFGAWTVNEVNSTSSSVVLRNSADSANMATHATSDDATTFSSGEPT